MAVAEKVKVEREQALKLLTWVGYKAAAKWDNDRMGGKLIQVKEIMPQDDQPKDPEVKETLDLVLLAIEEGSTFEVVGEFAGATAASGTSGMTEEEKAAKKAEKEKEAAAKKAEREKLAVTKKAEREAERAARKAARAASRAAKKNKNKMFCAGQVVRQFGIGGDKDEMVDALNELFGKPNDATSLACIKGALDAVKGFQAE